MELKPCPFCGKIPTTGLVFEKINIRCSNNKCPIKPDTWLHSAHNRADKVIKAWNTRVTPGDPKQ